MLLDEEHLMIVEVIPYGSFKEKIKLVKNYLSKADKVEVEKGYVYIEKTT